MFVEDILNVMATRYWSSKAFDGKLNEVWQNDFIVNVNEHVLLGKNLSTEQSKIILKLAAKIRDPLAMYLKTTRAEIDEAIANPTYKTPPYLSVTIKKEIRHLGANVIGFRFKFNNVIVEEFKKPEFYDNASFNKEHRIWMVNVTEDNIESIRSIIYKHRFEMDAKTRDYLALCQCSKNKPSFFTVNEETIQAKVNNNELLTYWLQKVAGGKYI